MSALVGFLLTLLMAAAAATALALGKVRRSLHRLWDSVEELQNSFVKAGPNAGEVEMLSAQIALLNKDRQRLEERYLGLVRQHRAAADAWRAPQPSAPQPSESFDPVPAPRAERCESESCTRRLSGRDLKGGHRRCVKCRKVEAPAPAPEVPAAPAPELPFVGGES